MISYCCIHAVACNNSLPHFVSLHNVCGDTAQFMRWQCSLCAVVLHGLGRNIQISVNSLFLPYLQTNRRHDPYPIRHLHQVHDRSGYGGVKNTQWKTSPTHLTDKGAVALSPKKEPFFTKKVLNGSLWSGIIIVYTRSQKDYNIYRKLKLKGARNMGSGSSLFLRIFNSGIKIL